MAKSKYFIFIVAMTAIVLLVLGNWVTSARATSVGIIDATPTPTGIPIEEADIPGEIPSVEEQGQLKSTVQSYFEISYHAAISSIIFSAKQKPFSEGEIHMRRMFGFLIGILVGALVGSTVALLLAPESGEKLRGEIRERGQGFINEVSHAADSRRIELRGRLETLRAPREVNL